MFSIDFVSDSQQMKLYDYVEKSIKYFLVYTDRCQAEINWFWSQPGNSLECCYLGFQTGGATHFNTAFGWNVQQKNYLFIWHYLQAIILWCIFDIFNLVFFLVSRGSCLSPDSAPNFNIYFQSSFFKQNKWAGDHVYRRTVHLILT